MGTYRRNGMVFTAATVNWTAGLSQNGGVSAVDQITQNVIDGFNSDPPGSINLVNAGFEDWPGNVPAGWALDGAGSVSPEDTDPDTSDNNMRFSGGGGSFCLKVDAGAGETWITQSDFTCDANAAYGAGCWARATQRGATIRLQRTDTWQDFAIAEHSGSGNWEYLFAIGSSPATAPFATRVKIQVAAGAQAWFDNVTVAPVPDRPE